MSRHVARDSMSAWARLRDAGELELDDREADFDEKLKIALLPSAKTLDEALQASSTDDLVRAFFDLVQPFAEMFRAILEFFEAAGAREGRAEWAIRIEGEYLDLKHFQTFLENWDAFECELDVPAIDSGGAWAVYRATQDLPGMERVLDFLDKDSRSTTGLKDVDAWLEAYARGEYLPYPASLHPARVTPQLADATAIAMASVEIIRRTWANREKMIDEHRARGYESDRGDGFSPRTIAQHETDFRLGSSIVYIARYASLDESSRQVFAQKLAQQLGRYPRRKIGVRAKQPALERILSLPLWRRRHELYAVWIATEIVNALDDHDCELHHEEGRITFAFRETVVATVHSSWPKVRLFAERRSPLNRPIGHGRTANVQPDYGLWRGIGDRETCGLVIEVKHCKRGSSSRFREVMVDYARAHREADVVLVNHGPARESFYDADADVRDRCGVIGELTMNHLDQRAAFRKTVRDYVKDPVSRGSRRDARRDTVIAIDVSASMSAALDSADFLILLDSLTDGRVGTIALIDSEIRRVCQIEIVADAIHNTPRGSATELRVPILSLLENHPRVLLVTDSDGVAGLTGLDLGQIASKRIGAVNVAIVDVSR